MVFGPSDPWPHSHYDLIEHYHAQYDRAIASGEYQPFVYPWGTSGALVVIIYLLVPHQNRPWLKTCRYLVFAWITAFATYSIVYTRTRGVAPALGLGLISAWSVAWVATILICNDAQTDFMRIERSQGVFGSDMSHEAKNKDSNASAEPKHASMRNDTKHVVDGSSGPRDRHGQFVWQPYPLSSFVQRLDWVLDIFCNFRGMGWNWRTSALPPPPKSIQTQLIRNSGTRVPRHTFKAHSSQVRQYTSRKRLLQRNLFSLLKGYVIMDLLKTIMMHDAYFWGGDMARPPPAYLAWMLTSSMVLTHAYRLVLSMLAVKYTIQTIFSLGPLVFSGLLSPCILGARAEPWMYPEVWASYDVVLEKGLAGWWGNWWHQTFRFVFQEPSRKMIDVLGLHQQSSGAKALQLFTAFFLSGVVHASASFTCLADTRPVRGPMTFFLAQAVAIFVEMWLTQVANRAGLGRNLPAWANKGCKFLYVHVWFYFTAHLLCDDFARCGVWLFEPVPFSLFRGLGLGADQRDGWWCWGGQLVWWHSGDRWWKSGIAF